MRAIIYLRVSTDKQKQSMTGLINQAEACIAKAKTLGLQEFYIIADPGVSGISNLEDRTGIRFALKILKANDYFLIFSVSRGARTSALAQELFEEVKARGAY